MKFGLSALIFGYDDVLNHIPLMASCNIKSIELRVYPPRIPYDDLEYIDKVKLALEQHNIEVHSFHLPFNHIDIASIDPEKREKSVEEVLKGVNLCKLLNGKLGVLHPGGKYGNLNDKPIAEENSIKSIKTIFDVCENNNIKLAVENMLPERIGEDYDFFKKLFEQINSPNIGLCFDSSHANVNGTVYEFLKQTKEKLFTVHFSDNLGSQDEHFFPFKGNIDWIKILKILDDISYKSIFLLEVATINSLTPKENLELYNETIEKISNLKKGEN